MLLLVFHQTILQAAPVPVPSHQQVLVVYHHLHYLIETKEEYQQQKQTLAHTIATLKPIEIDTYAIYQWQKKHNIHRRYTPHILGQDKPDQRGFLLLLNHLIKNPSERTNENLEELLVQIKVLQSIKIDNKTIWQTLQQLDTQKEPQSSSRLTSPPRVVSGGLETLATNLEEAERIKRSVPLPHHAKPKRQRRRHHPPQKP